MARTNADEKPTCEEKPRSQKRDLSHPPRVCRLQFVFSTEDSWAEGLAFGPPKVMKNGSSSVTTLPGSTALPFVISTEAQRSGEICGFSGPFLEMLSKRAHRAAAVAGRISETSTHCVGYSPV
jgi:hypothetical protein